MVKLLKCRVCGLRYDTHKHVDCPSCSQEMKTVKNLMSGKDVQIPVNTPRSCDPSTELYWSM